MVKPASGRSKFWTIESRLYGTIQPDPNQTMLTCQLRDKFATSNATRRLR
jgi:hypothetical protein